MEVIDKGWADLVSYGRLYVSNPDLAERIVGGLDVNYKWDTSTFYGHHHGQKGYTDYPFYKQS